MQLNELTAWQLQDLLARKEAKAEDIVNAVYGAIDQKEEQTGAFITLFKDRALEKANEIDNKLGSGKPVGALAGIPVAVKDNICIKDTPTTCASRILENFNPPYNATVVEKLEAADAVIIGKTNMDEFAMGSSSENSAFKPVQNPHDPARVAGGSSGGSAAAVAAHETILAVGSDTGGSIRQPAAFCGVTGLKPTYGRVSRYGLVAYASSLDQIGPLAKDVKDTALLLKVLAAYDPKDSTSAEVPVLDYAAYDTGDAVKNLTFGVPAEYLDDAVGPEVTQAVETAIQRLEEGGARRTDISLPHTPYAIPAYYIIASAEASSNLARYDGVTYGSRSREYTDLEDMYVRTRTAGFGDEVKRRIMLGTYVLSSGYYDAYYLKALKVRSLIKQDFDQAFEHCDLIITPTTPTPAFKQGEKTDDPIQMYLSDICTISCNLAGIPGLSLPGPGSGPGLPVGVQLYGRPFAEADLLRWAAWLEMKLA